MTTQLDGASIRLLAYLVEKLPAVVANDPRTFVSYKQVHDELGLALLGTYGTSLERQGLGTLAAWTSERGHPAITGLVIDHNKRMPGPGYFRLYRKREEDFSWWVSEIAKSKAYDWRPYVGLSAGPSVHNIGEVLPQLGGVARELERAAVWRLVAHHERPEEAATLMIAANVLAVGWGRTGDLAKLRPANASEIAKVIAKAYPEAENAHLGGPSLWNLYNEMKPGDLVILTANSRKLHVFEVFGDYMFDDSGVVLGYPHQRGAALTSLNPDDLWQAVGADVARGQNIRWTLARCTPAEGGGRTTYREGERYEIRSTAIERNPAARRKCLEHHGYSCAVCGFDFELEFGEIGKGYIHVHHRHDLALSPNGYSVDPIKDLVPLCPNCHAMAHRVSPAMDIEELVRRRKSRCS